MLRLSWVLFFISLSAFGQNYSINCNAKQKAIGTNWLITANIKGTLSRDRSEATLKDYSSKLQIYQADEMDAPWAETLATRETTSNDEYYHPVKYQNHYRFELDYSETDTYSNGTVHFIFPKSFAADSTTPAYLVLSGINSHFGGTVKISCRIRGD